MIGPAVIAFYRSLSRHPLYAALNLLGLSFGIAIFVVLSLFVRFETTYDQWLPGGREVYEVTTQRLMRSPEPRPRPRSSALTLSAVQQSAPGVVGTRIIATYGLLHYHGELIEEEGQLVDPDFFRVFDVPFVAGDAAHALRPGGVVLSETMARKYFGRTDVVGQRLTVANDSTVFTVMAGKPVPERSFVVTGVVKDGPANATVRFNLVRLFVAESPEASAYWDNWDNSGARTFFRFATPGAAHELDRRLERIVDTVGPATMIDAAVGTQPRHSFMRLHLMPLAKGHLADPRVMAAVIALGAAGGLAFLIALINYMNLATARAGLRAREIAMRRVMGATVAGLRQQFLMEALLVSLCASLFGFSLVELSLPVVNRAGGLSLRLDYGRDTLWLGAIYLSVLACGLLASVYPAFVLSSFQPVQVLSPGRPRAPPPHGAVVREGLVVAQFAVVTTLLIAVAGLTAQVHHMETSDLGLSREGLLITGSTIGSHFTPQQIGVLHERWRKGPHIVSVTDGTAPGRYFMYPRMALTRPGGATVSFIGIFIDRDYFTTFATPVLAGRALSEADYGERRVLSYLGGEAGTVAIDINLAAVRAFGFASPQAAVGQSLRFEKTVFEVRGVVADQRLGPPTDRLSPTFYFASDDFKVQESTILRYEGASRDVVVAGLRPAWKDLTSDMPLSFETGDEALDYYYTADRRTTRLFGLGAVVASLVGGLGLFGIAVFATSSRAFEIGLRKAMGASERQILRLLLARLLRPVLVANLIAWPVAWWWLGRWLAQFDDRVALSPWFFVTGSAFSLAIALLTVVGLTLFSSRASPARALRHE